MGSCTAGGAYVPGDERRDGHRPRAGHDLPRRPAAGEGGDRRGGHRRGARRRRRARAHLRRRRPPRRGRRARAGDRARRSSRTLPPRRPRRRGSASRRARRRRTPTACSTSSRSTRARPTTCATCCGAIVDGGELQEFKELYGTTSCARFAHLDGHPVGDRRQQRDPVQRVGAEGRALHRAVRPPRHPAAVRPEHLGLHGRPRLRGGRHRQGRRQARHRRRLRARAEAHA